jgi:hypothetical protein
MYMYFLLNRGQGYTGEFVGNMTFDEMNWHVAKLNDDLKEKHRLEREQAAKAQRRLKSRRH